MADSDTICPPFGCQPSDQGIASNGTLVVQVVNTAVEVYHSHVALYYETRHVLDLPSPGRR